MNVSRITPLWNQLRKKIVRLPLVLIAITSRCNSRCLMCTYWKNQKQDFPPEYGETLAQDLNLLQCRFIGLTGGEPLLYPQFRTLSTSLKQDHRRLFLITNGTLLKKAYHDHLLDNIDTLYVSLDGYNDRTHDLIRGKGTFATMMAGIDYLKSRKPSLPIIARCTIQKKNWKHIPQIVDTASEASFDHISFVAVDSYSQAYGRENSSVDISYNEIIPDKDDVVEMRRCSADHLHQLRKYFESGFISESLHKFRSLFMYLTAITGQHEFPHVRCNAPYFSLFINQKAEVAPCFFRPPIGSLQQGRLLPVLHKQSTYHKIMIDQETKEKYCHRCTCPLYRGFKTPSR